jgi:hypothetical protein
MAYMSQELKRELAPGIKAVLKKYGMKGSIGVRHYSTLVVNIKSGDLNIMREINRSNRVDCQRHWNHLLDYQQRDYESLSAHSVDQYQGIIGQFVNEIIGAMMTGNFDKFDIMSDYHHVGWYIDINVGKYDTPYIWNAPRQKVAA